MLPETFVMPMERDSFLRRLSADMIHQSSLWIMKPVAASCGRGIKVVTNSQASAIVSTKPTKKCLFQRYVANPYLIDGHKFDLRIYVLVTGVDPLRLYVHEEGLIRISTVPYSTKNISNRFDDKEIVVSSNFIVTPLL
jgi:glutathione synthase/RimK-type ligase-like ATP-grasp enzyme